MAQLRRENSAHARRAAVCADLKRRRERGMLGRTELKARHVHGGGEPFNGALYPEKSLFGRDGPAAVERTAANWPREAERKTVCLERLAVLGLSEHAPELEELRRLELMRCVAPKRAHQLRQQRVAQHAILGAHRIGQRKARRLHIFARIERIQLASGEERIVHALREAERKARSAHLLLGAERRVGERRDARRARHCVRNVVEPVDAGDLLHEVSLKREIPTPAGDAERKSWLGGVRTLLARLQTEAVQDVHHRVVANGNAD